ncbi:uncharacterized protein [Hyperolius riggenbachi]|uniref:uncharacterized protein n=1 Tax=Hyperolius riggenbachi TaxID=752182 RepID=UPI0035A3AB7E
MVADTQKFLISLLLISISEQGKAHSNVTFEKGEPMPIIINCSLEEQKIEWYKYNMSNYGVGVFNKENSSKQYKVAPGGGIFACTTKSTTPYTGSKDLLYDSHKTFVISPLNDTLQKYSATATDNQKVTLSCHVNLRISFVLLWIVKYAKGSTQCLSSVEIQQQYGRSHNISSNELCRPPERMFPRLNQSDLQYILDIENITHCDYGEYFCIIYLYENGYQRWRHVNTTLLSYKTPAAAYIIAGSVGGISALVAILILVFFCLKTKGLQENVNNSHSNAQDPLEEYECTPYAVGRGGEEKINSMYSCVSTIDPAYAKIVKKPSAVPGAEYVKAGTSTLADPSPEYSEVVTALPNAEYSTVGAESLGAKNTSDSE